MPEPSDDSEGERDELRHELDKAIAQILVTRVNAGRLGLRLLRGNDLSEIRDNLQANLGAGVAPLWKVYGFAMLLRHKPITDDWDHDGTNEEIIESLKCERKEIVEEGASVRTQALIDFYETAIEQYDKLLNSQSDLLSESLELLREQQK